MIYVVEASWGASGPVIWGVFTSWELLVEAIRPFQQAIDDDRPFSDPERFTVTPCEELNRGKSTEDYDTNLWAVEVGWFTPDGSEPKSFDDLLLLRVFGND
jgi:hypothetical protein